MSHLSKSRLMQMIKQKDETIRNLQNRIKYCKNEYLDHHVVAHWRTKCIKFERENKIIFNRVMTMNAIATLIMFF